MEISWNGDAAGLFALKRQTRLLQSSLAPWPRRGKSLVEINCGQGQFLPLLWDCGFDLSATELNPQLRTLAREAAGGRVEVDAAADDYLPFEDNAFDWAVLHVNAEDQAGLEACLREALRVTAGGLAVTFWNAASLPCLLHRLCQRKSPWPGPTHSWRRVWRTLKECKVGRLSSQNTLFCPPLFWRAGVDCAVLRPLPAGAWCVIRLDMAPLSPVTPLPLRLRPGKLNQPQPALECSPKRARRSTHLTSPGG